MNFRYLVNLFTTQGLHRVRTLSRLFSSLFTKMEGKIVSPNGTVPFNTQIMAVDPSNIKFAKDAIEPEISDKKTLDTLLKAVNTLKNTHSPVAFPTETVYGLGASALDTDSVKGIYQAKNRPADNPLIVHVASLDQLKRILLPPGESIPEIYVPLVEKFWPGPLTILLPVTSSTPVSEACTVGQDTFAVRIPDNVIARSLIALSDLPLAAPSANASTKPSTTTAQHVYHDLHGKIPLIIDGGSCSVGVESTVVNGLSDPPMILRPGGLSVEQIKHVGGRSWQNVVVSKGQVKEGEAVRTPGMKYKHYSPDASVVLFIDCGDGVEEVENYLQSLESVPEGVSVFRTRKFQKSLADHLKQKYNIDVEDVELGTSGKDISRNLFLNLRQADEKNRKLILVEGVEETDEGLAIMNRLQKASSTIVRCSTSDDDNLNK